MFNDLTYSAMRVALTGLAARQNAIANNIANVETPGYRAQKVKFEDALHSAIANRGSVAGVTHSTLTSLEPTRLNGNNVNLDQETLSHIDTTMRYQLAIRMVDGRYNGLREAIKGG